MASKTKSPASRSNGKNRPLAFPAEFRLRIVKLYLEEGCRPKLLVEQFGISTHSIQRWVKAFRLHGAAGLEPKRPVSRKSRVADEVLQAGGGRQGGASRARPPSDNRCAQAVFSDAHQPLDSSQDARRVWAGEMGLNCGF
jgi:transposase-like protein